MNVIKLENINAGRTRVSASIKDYEQRTKRKAQRHYTNNCIYTNAIDVYKK